MQFIPFYLFTIICGYSLVFSTPINQAVQDSQETKHQKASVIANHLLKELANEHLADQSTNKEPQQIESDIEKQEEDNEDFEHIPTIDIYYPVYDNINDEDSSSEIVDVDDIFPIDEQDLMRYLEEEQEEYDEDFIPVIHTSIMDDSIMKAEHH